MLDDRYSVNNSPDFLTFEFLSIGPKGQVAKVVRYSEVNVKGFYNLGFGDKGPMGVINDISVTNNGDSQKVLATVAATLFEFFDEYPDAIVVASGSTLARTRLYRMGIANNLDVIETNFDVYGLVDAGWEPFKKGTTYSAFFVRRKL